MSEGDVDVQKELEQLQAAIAAITRKLAGNNRLVIGGAADPHKCVILADDLRQFGWPTKAHEIPKGDK
jgi:hypothetical protein